MNKPKIFISSTIYDFQDLRSALKYWFQEYGYEAQLSEYNDFQKDLSINSYDACLNAIENCDYFILLIGSRRGGLYPCEEKSITQKEYEKAYELAKQGKIKRIITFIRKSVWDVKEDRKALAKTIKSIKQQKNIKDYPESEIVYHDSSLIQEAESIISFINQVTRNEEAKNNQKPMMNWVHTFVTFSDIIEAIKTELNLNQRIATVVAEQNIKNAVIRNLQFLLSEEQGHLVSFYNGYNEINSILSKKRKEYVEARNSHKEYYVLLSYEQINRMSNFVLFYFIGINEIQSFVFEQVLSSGAFLEYSNNKDCFIKNNFYHSISQMIFEIQQLKQSYKDYSSDDIDGRLVTKCKEGLTQSKSVEFRYRDLAILNSLFIRIANIVKLSSFMIKYINTHNEGIPFPDLYNSLSNQEIPNEKEIEEYLLNISC